MNKIKVIIKDPEGIKPDFEVEGDCLDYKINVFTKEIVEIVIIPRTTIETT